MTRSQRRVGIIGVEGANALDIVGPLEAFATAGRSDAPAAAGGAYQVSILGFGTQPFVTESGAKLVPDERLERVTTLDTVLVPGGPGLREPRTNARVASWLARHAPRIRRIACVCTGLYALAPTGLLDGRRATTHWRFAEDAARRFPRIRLEGDALFIRDGRFYTSGGVTAGIDLALALIEEDLGRGPALAVARELVMYLKRSGGQQQYSEPLRYQMRAVGPFAELVEWIASHLAADLSTAALAARANLSPRHFGRRFLESTGTSPAAFVEHARLDAARERLAAGAQSVDRIARGVGYRSADVFRRRFEARFGIAPTRYRARFASSGPFDGPAPSLERS